MTGPGADVVAQGDRIGADQPNHAELRLDGLVVEVDRPAGRSGVAGAPSDLRVRGAAADPVDGIVGRDIPVDLTTTTPTVVPRFAPRGR